MNIPLFCLSQPIWARSLSRGYSLLKRQISIIFKHKTECLFSPLPSSSEENVTQNKNFLSICLFLLFFFLFSLNTSWIFFFLSSSPVLFPPSRSFFYYFPEVICPSLLSFSDSSSLSSTVSAHVLNKHSSMWREPPKELLEKGWVSILP